MKMHWVITVVQHQSWSMAPKSNKLSLLVLISWSTDRSLCHRSKSWSAASRPCGGDQFPVQCQSSRCLVQIVHPGRNHRSWLPVGSAAGSHHIRCSGKHVYFLMSRVRVKYDKIWQKLDILEKSNPSPPKPGPQNGAFTSVRVGAALCLSVPSPKRPASAATPPPPPPPRNLITWLELKYLLEWGWHCVFCFLQQHETFLPGGDRAAYLIGDGAGVGKGRTIAGVIYENYLLGRKRSLWYVHRIL